MHSALIFDLDNTLIDRDQLWAKFCPWLIDRFGNLLPQSIRANLSTGLAKMNSLGDQSPEKLWSWLQHQGFSSPEMRNSAQFWESYQWFLKEAIKPDAPILDLLRNLRSRYSLAILTNGGNVIQRIKLRSAGLEPFFTQIWISEGIGLSKPDPALFQLALQELKAEPSQVLMIGDDPQRDIEPAGKLGISTCWISQGRTYPEQLSPPNFIMKSVVELSQVLPDFQLEAARD